MRSADCVAVLQVFGLGGFEIGMGRKRMRIHGLRAGRWPGMVRICLLMGLAGMFLGRLQAQSVTTTNEVRAMRGLGPLELASPTDSTDSGVVAG